MFSRLLDSVPDWGRHAGSKGAPKQPKKSKKTYPKHAHHCQGFRLHRLRSVSSRAVIRQCFDKLPATPSQNFLGLSPATPEICGGETYQKGSKIIKNIQKSLAGGKMEKYSFHVQSSEPASQSLTVFDRQTECTKPSSG